MSNSVRMSSNVKLPKRKVGRPKGQGPYGEATYPMRIPISMVEEVKWLIANKNIEGGSGGVSGVTGPLYGGGGGSRSYRYIGLKKKS